jgi:hypothetical protein
MIDYILLPRHEWGKVLPIFEENGVGLPQMGMIAAAVDGNKVGAFLCLQPQYHTEPLWIDPLYRGRVNFLSLQKALGSQLPQGTEYYVFAPNEKISGMAALGGMQEKKYRVWKGVF